MSKARIALDLPDLSGIQPRQVRPETNVTEIARAAEEAGFKARHASPTRQMTEKAVTASFDARTLRRSKRKAQLNIATQQDTRDRFWNIAIEMGVTSGDEVLVALLDAYDRAAR